MFFQYLINGLSIGSVYALLAIGYNFVYGILELLNFAHGDVYTLGVFVTFALLLLKQNVAVAILGGLVVGYGVNICVERFAYRPVRFSGRVTPTISAVGIAYIMRNVILTIWGPETYAFDLGIAKGAIRIGGLVLGTLQIYILAFSVCLMIVVTILLKKTRIGQAVLSISQSIPTAMLMGIPVNNILSIVYGLGAVLGVVGGILFCEYYASIFVGMGFMLGTMKAWMASIIGGIGSLKGAVLGALILGLAESFVSGYISTTYRDAFVWGILIIVILIRPQGLFPAQIAEKI